MSLVELAGDSSQLDTVEIIIQVLAHSHRSSHSHPRKSLPTDAARKWLFLGMSTKVSGKVFLSRKNPPAEATGQGSTSAPGAPGGLLVAGSRSFLILHGAAVCNAEGETREFWRKKASAISPHISFTHDCLFGGSFRVPRIPG